jgi:hypothetical protein
MFSKGWQATQTRSIVDSAASENCCSSSAVISPTLLAIRAGSTLAGGLACGGAALTTIAVRNNVEAATRSGVLIIFIIRCRSRAGTLLP